MTPPTITARSLNRALMARQLLLERQDVSPLDAIRHLVGMQAQTPLGPYVGLWSRLRRFDPAELSKLMVDRAVVRIAAMRSTVHLLTAEDALELRPLTQTVSRRGMQSAFGKDLAGVDLDQLAEAARGLLEGPPLTLAALGAALTERWPATDPAALGNAARALLPLVQVPPRGVWGKGGAAAHTPIETWLGRPVASKPSAERAVRRYLAAFGPASVADAQKWSGLTRLGEVFDGLRPELVVFTDGSGREVFDLPDAPRPAEDVPAPPRFLPVFDNLIYSHSDRTRFIRNEERRLLPGTAAWAAGSLLVDGRFAGTWKGSDAGVTIEACRDLTDHEWREVEAEQEALARFLLD